VDKGYTFKDPKRKRGMQAKMGKVRDETLEKTVIAKKFGGHSINEISCSEDCFSPKFFRDIGMMKASSSDI